MPDGILSVVSVPSKVERRRLRRLEALVREVLLAWDPIGGVPDDEYDCLVWPAIKRLDGGASPDELASWLSSELGAHYGVEPRRTDPQYTAQRLYDVWAAARR